jgi:hypothetical protein
LSTQGRFESAAWGGIEDAVEDVVDGLCAIGEIAEGVGEDVLFVALEDAGRFGAFKDLFENNATLEDGLEGLIFFGVVGRGRDGFEITGRCIRRRGLGWGRMKRRRHRVFEGKERVVGRRVYGDGGLAALLWRYVLCLAGGRLGAL